MPDVGVDALLCEVGVGALLVVGVEDLLFPVVGVATLLGVLRTNPRSADASLILSKLGLEMSPLLAEGFKPVARLVKGFGMLVSMDSGAATGALAVGDRRSKTSAFRARTMLVGISGLKVHPCSSSFRCSSSRCLAMAW